MEEAWSLQGALLVPEPTQPGEVKTNRHQARPDERTENSKRRIPLIRHNLQSGVGSHIKAHRKDADGSN